MSKIDLLKLVDSIDENSDQNHTHNRYLLIDGLNLFFRNFSAINSVNSNGTHIGGLGGFLRSLGFLIRTIQPTHLYVIFDGVGGSNNRKNIIPEYKSRRNTQRITNWDVFEDLEEEDDAKVNQIVRLIQYLKHLPLRTTAIDKVEADDIIAYLSNKLIKNESDKVFIVSNDGDYLQLVTPQITVFKPTEREFYTHDVMIEKFNLSPNNFILYKMLLGDASDKVSGVKGLGKKGLFKKFPELSERDLTFDDIIDICAAKIDEHIVYARVINEMDTFKDKYQIMDLKNHMIDENNKILLDGFIESPPNKYHPESFLRLYKSDQLGNLIKNPEIWLKENFEHLK